MVENLLFFSSFPYGLRDQIPVNYGRRQLKKMTANLLSLGVGEVEGMMWKISMDLYAS